MAPRTRCARVALLALAAMGPNSGVPAVYTLLLPFLFAAGMSLLDTLDGILMLWAYGWALLGERALAEEGARHVLRLRPVLVLLALLDCLRIL